MKTKKYSRRDFIKIGGLAAAMAALSSCSPAKTSTPTTEILGTLRPVPTSPGMQSAPSIQGANFNIERTLKRITFGLRPDEIARAGQIGIDNYIDEQLAPASITDTALEAMLTQFATLNQSAAELAAVAPRTKPALELSQATVLRAAYSRRQLNELMVDFWSNHFNIYLGKDTDRFLKTIDDREVIRPNALGNFHDLLLASMHSPAMLIYLDNAHSTKDLPNENYAREIMELHTLSVNGGYSQADVTEVARALTGWTVQGLRGSQPGDFIYTPRIHDDGEKHILGNIISAGQGIQDGEMVADILANHPATANFIATKLVRRFVSDDPPPSLVTRAAAAFTSSHGNIATVMATILHSDEFRSNLSQKFKRPFEFVVSAIRSTNARLSPGPQTVNLLARLGQPLFRWESPNGFPDSAGAWASTSGMLARWNFGLALAFNTLKEAPVALTALAQSGDPSGMVDTLSHALIGEPVSDQAKAILVNVAASAAPEQAIPALTALLIGSPFFQYR